MLATQKAEIGLSKGGRPALEKTGNSKVPVSAPTLSEVGIDKNLSSRAQKLAATSLSSFDTLSSQQRAELPQASALRGGFSFTGHAAVSARTRHR